MLEYLFLVILSFAFGLLGAYFFSLTIWQVVLLVLLLMAVYKFFRKINKIFAKRSLGIALKELLFFLFCFSVCLNFIQFFSVLQKDLAVVLPVGFFLLIVITRGVSNLLVMRKKQEFQLMGFKCIGKYDLYHNFANAEDKNTIDQLLNDKKIWKCNFFLEHYFFCHPDEDMIIRLVQEILNRVEAVETGNTYLTNESAF